MIIIDEHVMTTVAIISHRQNYYYYSSDDAASMEVNGSGVAGVGFVRLGARSQFNSRLRLAASPRFAAPDTCLPLSLSIWLSHLVCIYKGRPCDEIITSAAGAVMLLSNS